MISLAASSGVLGGGFDSLHASTSFLYLHISKCRPLREKKLYNQAYSSLLFLILSKYIRISVNKMDI